MYNLDFKINTLTEGEFLHTLIVEDLNLDLYPSVIENRFLADNPTLMYSQLSFDFVFTTNINT